MYVHTLQIHFQNPSQGLRDPEKSSPNPLSWLLDHWLTVLQSHCSLHNTGKQKKKNQALGCFQHVQGSQAVRPQNQRICLTLLCLKLLYLWSRDHASGHQRTVMITSELWTLVHSLPYHGPHHHNLCILFPLNSPENKSSLKNVPEMSFF